MATTPSSDFAVFSLAAALLFAALSLLLFWAHRANIRRLLAGEEPRIGAKG